MSTKLPVIQGLLNQVDKLVLGGGLAYTFAKAQGIPIGSSLCEEGMIETAKDLIKEAEEKGKNMYLPIDAVCAPGFPKEPMALEDTKTFDMVPGAGVEDGWMGLDVGPKTIELFREALTGCSKIIFNGELLHRRKRMSDSLSFVMLILCAIAFSPRQVPWECSKSSLSTRELRHSLTLSRIVRKQEAFPLSVEEIAWLLSRSSERPRPSRTFRLAEVQRLSCSPEISCQESLRSKTFLFERTA